ncbi:hypothetical protein BTUL_0245g00040 [Botrytis tulipae]|uniref:Uncharacterized protein n=1 Tax=Botrytis tulipae TaxID=87230 RepID=A0A4Z1EEI4_9HELO|nr:hypothetical protein BTUL_0245g00040 [Botrytis tulipae]
MQENIKSRISKANGILTSDDFIVEHMFPIRNLLGYTKELLEQDEAPQITEATKEDDLMSRNAAQFGLKESEENGTEDSKRQDVGTFLHSLYPLIPPDHAIRRTQIYTNTFLGKESQYSRGVVRIQGDPHLFSSSNGGQLESDSAAKVSALGYSNSNGGHHTTLGIFKKIEDEVNDVA